MTIKKATPPKQSSPLACTRNTDANHQGHASKHKRTKIAQVLAHLIDRRSITSIEAFSQYKATRLSAIIHKLRGRYSLNISTEILDDLEGGTRFGRYHLADSALVSASKLLEQLDSQSNKKCGGADA
ncbi:helix-turn-helix domain-containing protein [Thiopseudomonas alkaliphila]|mgnify:CR=1 FL=1|uniref:helix-turn-helix domain-containing protein n=1 Tax=Thiopseudomonas alkaliphila TaxID=1697053 RepID=UPI0025775194|nr:helix-turn-helix domain-containing protein [Thiopseudomonas alkaliphila]MDM1707697.1 hypothetical protein [Thiopseudomonas alkaliphila]